MGGRVLFLLIIFSATVIGQSIGGPKHGKKVVCYLASWSAYRKDPLQFQAPDFDASLCTHLVYSFALLDEQTNDIYSSDKYLDINSSNGRTGYNAFVALKKQHPHLIVTLSIGGWNDGSLKYSKMVANSTARRQFIESVVIFLQTHKFDGLDIMWKYPTARGGDDEDKANFVLLIKELKEAFQEHKYILTAALGGSKELMNSAYDLVQLNQYLDLIHILAYDYYGPWDGVIGSNAPINGTDVKDTRNVEYMIRYMIAFGVSPEKMVLGLPLYGRTFLLTDPKVNAVKFGATTAKAVGFPGPILNGINYYGYHEVCLELKNKTIPWTYHWDEQSSTPYLRDGDRIISYDNPRSIASKVKLAIDYNLGGFMVWSMDTDDFKGLCDIRNDTYKDFEDRFKSISEDPDLQDALDIFVLPIQPKHGKKVVCYLASWSAYRKDPLQFQAPDFDASLCTHLVYSFALLDDKTNDIYSSDKYLDIDSINGKTGYNAFVALKKHHPHLIVTLSIGGWNDGSLKYSNMVANSTARRQFIESVVIFLQTHKFDGLDIMWKYPTARGGDDEDKANFVLLIKELKEAFQEHKYILTAALGGSKELMNSAYDLVQLNQYLDLIHILAYDYYGPWDGVIGSNAPLNGPDVKDTRNVEYMIRYMIAFGVSPEKMVLGLPLYGRTFLLTDPKVNAVKFGATTAKGVGFPGPILNGINYYGYHEVCLELKNKTIPWTYHWDEQSSTPYLRDGDRIISYDNPRSIASKVKLAIDYNLGGFMVWSMDTDDFKGLCDIRNDTYKDFEDRFKSISEDPDLQDALDIFVLPILDSQEEDRFYAIENNKLKFNIREQNFPNYQLMRTLNQATCVALDEIKILESLWKIKGFIKDEKNTINCEQSEQC